MAELVGLGDAVRGQDLVVAAWGELYDVLVDGVVGVVGQQAASQALPVRHGVRALRRDSR